MSKQSSFKRYFLEASAVPNISWDGGDMDGQADAKDEDFHLVLKNKAKEKIRKLDSFDDEYVYLEGKNMIKLKDLFLEAEEKKKDSSGKPKSDKKPAPKKKEPAKKDAKKADKISSPKVNGKKAPSLSTLAKQAISTKAQKPSPDLPDFKNEPDEFPFGHPEFQNDPPKPESDPFDANDEEWDNIQKKSKTEPARGVDSIPLKKAPDVKGKDKNWSSDDVPFANDDDVKEVPPQLPKKDIPSLASLAKSAISSVPPPLPKKQATANPDDFKRPIDDLPVFDEPPSLKKAAQAAGLTPKDASIGSTTKGAYGTMPKQAQSPFKKAMAAIGSDTSYGGSKTSQSAPVPFATPPAQTGKDQDWQQAPSAGADSSMPLLKRIAMQARDTLYPKSSSSPLDATVIPTEDPKWPIGKVIKQFGGVEGPLKVIAKAGNVYTLEKKGPSGKSEKFKWIPGGGGLVRTT